MNSLQADIALRNLKSLDENNEKIGIIRDIYNYVLGIDNTSSHLYRINVNDNQRFIKKMLAKDVICGIHYKPQHDNEVYMEYSVKEKINDFKKSEAEGKTTVSIPFHPYLSEKEQYKVISEIKSYNDEFPI